MHNLPLTAGSRRQYQYCLKAGSHDPIFSLALFQLMEMLIRVSNFFFEFEQKSDLKIGSCEHASREFMKLPRLYGLDRLFLNNSSEILLLS